MADKKTTYGNYQAVEKEDGIHVIPNSAPAREIGGTKERVNNFIANSGKSTFEKLKDMVERDQAKDGK